MLLLFMKLKNEDHNIDQDWHDADDDLGDNIGEWLGREEDLP